MAETMTSARPPAPEELAYNLHHLVAHNAATPPYDRSSDAAYPRSQPASSRFASPLPAQMSAMHDQYLSPGYGQSPEMYGDDVGLGIHYDGYGSPGPAYYEPAYSHTSSPYVQANPPTPQSTHSDAGVRTRSGRRVGRDGTPSSRETSAADRKRFPKPSKKAAKAAKSDKTKAPRLTQPLSILTKDMEVPIKDMEAWVNRSASVRRKEVEDRKGYVTRPMNSFMLYRSAYAERTKQWGLHNNHQVVSSMAGESWPLEPAEVREHYNELAKLERTNHQAAHPDYKFSPSKAASTKKRRIGSEDSDQEDDESVDYDDLDAEWGAGRKGRGKRRRMVDSAVRELSPFAPVGGKPLPQAMGAMDPYAQYYHPGFYPQYAPVMEEPKPQYLPTHHRMPYASPPPAQPILALPGGQHHEMLQMATPPPSSQLDPGLMYEAPQSYIDGMGFPPSMSEQAPAPIPADFLGTVQEEWQVDPALQMLETGGEFDNWMDDDMSHRDA